MRQLDGCAQNEAREVVLGVFVRDSPSTRRELRTVRCTRCLHSEHRRVSIFGSATNPYLLLEGFETRGQFMEVEYSTKSSVKNVSKFHQECYQNLPNFCEVIDRISASMVKASVFVLFALLGSPGEVYSSSQPLFSAFISLQCQFKAFERPHPARRMNELTWAPMCMPTTCLGDRGRE